MAGCYHDKQDFKSDLDIEVAREGDILEDGQDLDEIGCEKNPGHRGFIPFKDLTLDHLPDAVRYKETLDGIKKMGRIVVRIVQDGLVGSGYVERIRHDSGDPVFGIKTNHHVVNSDDGVRRCTVEFHYDSKDRLSVVTSKGVKLIVTCPRRDITLFQFYPIPDFLYRLDWDRTPSTVIMYKDGKIVTGETMEVCYQSQSYVSRLNINRSFIHLMFLSWPSGFISYINSPYFKFQPISSNIMELTSIEIHIDGDYFMRRVISGDVVKFGNEFVVKISESIFQDEVKKCRLVWNGEVIGRGTRLYFEQITTSKISSEMSSADAEWVLKLWNQDNSWLFDCDQPTDVKDTPYTPYTPAPLNMCCIGHPHGGIKMVTFGYALAHSRERFDTQGRRLAKLGKCHQYDTVTFMDYSCKTCKGSSGSPVFLLSDEKQQNLSIQVTHFKCKRPEVLVSNGEQIGNLNSGFFQAPR